MKINIERIDYNGRLNPMGKWWRWQEFCDICGADCGKTGWQTMQEPDVKEEDYCLSCLRKLMEEKKKYYNK